MNQTESALNAFKACHQQSRAVNTIISTLQEIKFNRSQQIDLSVVEIKPQKCLKSGKQFKDQES